MLLNLLEKLGRKRIIMDRQGKEPYLERYYLFLKDRKRFPFNVFIHKFLKGDPSDPHDHPWPYATLILSGGYYEWVPQFNPDRTLSCEVRKWRGAGHFRICSPTSYHRIELKKGIVPWTLFIPGPQVREWGFWANNEWVQHEDYIEGNIE
jgi:hypothetical protein